MGRRAAAAALVEKEHVIAFRIEQAAVIGRYAAAGAAMQEDGRLGARRPGPLPIDAVAVAHIEMSGGEGFDGGIGSARSEEPTSELQELMRIPYVGVCWYK